MYGNTLRIQIDPALGEMHMQLIRVIDKFRMLDPRFNKITTKSKCCIRVSSKTRGPTRC